MITATRKRCHGQHLPREIFPPFFSHPNSSRHVNVMMTRDKSQHVFAVCMMLLPPTSSLHVNVMMTRGNAQHMCAVRTMGILEGQGPLHGVDLQGQGYMPVFFF